ncbi:MAG: hypothetical protein ACF8XB_06050 [Planctomycetota bacterium JB042]
MMISLAVAAWSVAALAAADDAESPAGRPAAPKAPEAVALLERAQQWMGGREAYDGVRYLKFRYDIRDGVVSKSRRDILWDRKEERVRFGMETTRGTLVVLLDLRGKSGVAFENGERLPEKDRAAVVNRAYGYALNDIRWLVLPWRAMEPDVELRLAPRIERDGVVSERVEAILDGDLYRLHVAPGTGEIRGWEWKPSALPEDQPPLEFTWEGWAETGGVKWSTERGQVGGTQRIVFTGLETPRQVPDAEFEEH